MQTLYAIHTNMVGQVSVDVFSDKHQGVSRWRCYFVVTPSTVARLRRIYAAVPRRFYISRKWSANRWKAYRWWKLGRPIEGTAEWAGASLD